MPRTTAAKKELDSRDVKPQTRTIEMLELEDERAPIETVKVMPTMSEAEALQFAEEKLTIVIHKTGEKNPEDPVYVSVNGRGGHIWRGQHTILARKYVERLLMAKADSVQQDVNAREEVDFNRLTIVPSQRYPLSIIHDPSPKSHAWLMQVAGQG